MFVTVHQETRDALPAVATLRADGTFGVWDVIRELRRRGSTYATSTISTHVTSRMCANAPKNHTVVYDDIESLGHGRYRRGQTDQANASDEGAASPE